MAKGEGPVILSDYVKRKAILPTMLLHSRISSHPDINI